MIIYFIEFDSLLNAKKIYSEILLNLNTNLKSKKEVKKNGNFPKQNIIIKRYTENLQDYYESFFIVKFFSIKFF